MLSKYPRLSVTSVAALLLLNCESKPKVADEAGVPRDVASDTIVDGSGYRYNPKDRSCDGFPRLNVATMPGTCLGLVVPYDKSKDEVSGKAFVMPRTILEIPGTKTFFVVDMGGWKANAGVLFLLKPVDGRYTTHALKTGLNTPHGLQLAPDGFYYLGETDEIWRFKYENGKMGEWQLVTKNLPRFAKHAHPLTSFAFDPVKGDMFINSGAPSDHCFVKETGDYQFCPEDESMGLGAIYRVPAAKLTNIPAGGLRIYEHYAQGLRNSMALAVHSSGTVVQGENSRDFPELEEPYEELNVVKESAHHGWPYCYDFKATSPEWQEGSVGSPMRSRFNKPVNCESYDASSTNAYQAPHTLMPPHVAPLHMAYYGGSMFPELKGKLLVAWHGYQPAGHRLVSYDVDSKGQPLLSSTSGATYNSDLLEGCPEKKPFKPKGGLVRHAQYTEVISRWNEIKGVRPKGAPVGFAEASDGSIYLVEDRKNRTIVRLARTDQPAIADNCGSSGPVEGGNNIDKRYEMLAWRNVVRSTKELDETYQVVRTKLIERYCATECHTTFKSFEIGKDDYATLDFMVKFDYFKPRDLEGSPMYGASMQTGNYKPMPPGGSPQLLEAPEGKALIERMGAWISKLPTDVPQRVKRVAIREERNIRDRPGTTNTKVCGAYKKGETVYVDPRPEARVQTGSTSWTRVYLLPGDRHLTAGCSYPPDGIHWVALK